MHEKVASSCNYKLFDSLDAMYMVLYYNKLFDSLSAMYMVLYCAIKLHCFRFHTMNTSILIDQINNFSLPNNTYIAVTSKIKKEGIVKEHSQRFENLCY